MKTRIIAVANHKGGVGKTTTVANVGSILAKAGMRVLMVDLDSQCNLTTSFDLLTEGEDIYTLFMERRGGTASNVRENLDIIPGSIDMANLDARVAVEYEREKILKDVLDGMNVRERYDLVLLDCPPSLGLVIVNAFVAADDIYVPIRPEFYPTIGLVRLEEICGHVKARLNPAVDIRGVIVTMINATKGLHKELETKIREKYGNLVFETAIRENVKLAESPVERKDIFDYAPKSNGAMDYIALSKEIVSRVSAGTEG